ncbi:hypothetical protein J4H92_00715 [Leucobacter weissii]|uniref:Uncharacterized protein n=1 Tax=Leucobacter weissii TaxID=1983706 RepID=A0A939MGI2_9MICO|nr:hypothetical protein [Leucobacter weissii]MBO1900468.1 hypothetical protein [Leucobacter weissii]
MVGLRSCASRSMVRSERGVEPDDAELLEHPPRTLRLFGQSAEHPLIGAAAVGVLQRRGAAPAGAAPVGERHEQGEVGVLEPVDQQHRGAVALPDPLGGGLRAVEVGDRDSAAAQEPPRHQQGMASAHTVGARDEHIPTGGEIVRDPRRNLPP